MNSLNILEQYLKSRHVVVDKEWIKACVQWIEEESEGHVINLEKLKTAVYDQWLFSDLREIGTSSFPENLATLQKTVLNGSYTVQMMNIRDISQPAYAQLMKLQGKDNENLKVTGALQPNESKWEPKSNRMLMLKITDGSQYVQAMEYKSVPALNVNLSPGIKLLVCGPIECRFGVLMLTAEHVRILGGDVESLAEEFNYQKFLARQLNKPEMVSVPIVQRDSTPVMPLSEVFPNEPCLGNNRPVVNEQVAILDDVFDDDDVFLNLSPDCYFDGESEAQDISNDRGTHDLQDVDDMDFGHSDIDMALIDNEQDGRKSSPILNAELDCDTIFSPVATVIRDENDSCSNRDSIPFGNENWSDSTVASSVLRNLCFSSKPESESKEVWDSAPFTYLHYILGRKSVSQPFTIKGYISTVTSKVTVKPDTGWRVQAVIDDGSASVEVVLSNDVLTKFIGLSPQDVVKLKMEAKSNPSVLSKLSEAIAKCQDTLTNLNCLMKVQLIPETTLLQCTPVESYHIQQLFDRVSKNDRLC